MPSTMDLLEVEVDSPRNDSLHFLPASKRVRGRFDLGRACKTSGAAGKLMNDWPDPIPGQRIGINLRTHEGYIAEPLHEAEHLANRQRIEERKMRLPAERQSFNNCHLPTWLYWLKRAVEAGLARVVKGELPETIEGEPRKSFHMTHQPDQSKLLTDAINRQTEALVKQGELLAQQQELFAKILGELTKKR